MAEVPRTDLSLKATDKERADALNALEAAYADGRIARNAFEARSGVVLREGGVRRADLLMAVADLGVDLYAPPVPAKDYLPMLVAAGALMLLAFALILIVVI